MSDPTTSQDRTTIAALKTALDRAALIIRYLALTEPNTQRRAYLDTEATRYLVMADHDWTTLTHSSLTVPPLNGLNACTCDFCTGRKKYSDNWCARCAKVKLVPPAHWENLDACAACEAVLRTEAGEEVKHG